MKEIQDVDPENLVFIDETGITTAMAKAYGRAPKGEPAYDDDIKRKGKHVSVIGALNISGISAAMSIEGYVDGDVFLAYVDQVLVPELSPGDVVVMDNLNTHKINGVEKAINNAGARVVFLPPYTPELNPIELAWSKLKNFLRTFRATALESLDFFLSEGLESISQKDAQGWFSHAGYCI